MRNRLKALLGARLRLGLSKQAFAVLREDTWDRNSAILGDMTLTQDAPLQQLVDQCRVIFAEHKCTGLPLQVTVSDEWARLFIVTPPQNCTRLQDMQAAAAMRFQSLYGEAMTDWHLEADWQVSTPFLACALPGKLIDALRTLAQENKLRLAAIKPQFVVAWNATGASLGKDNWFGVVHDNHLTLGALSATPADHLAATRHYAIPEADQDSAWLQEQVGRIALQIDTAMPQQISLVGNRRQLWTAKSGKASKNALQIVNLEKGVAATSHDAAVSSSVLLARAGGKNGDRS